MTLNRHVPIRSWRYALGMAIVIAMSACSSTVPRPPQIRVTPVRRVLAPPQVIALAQTFADQFSAGEYAAQWPELAPEAQAMWPSEAARTAMLSRKFAHAAVSSITLGTPGLEPMWTAPEDPALHVADVWSIPTQPVFTAAESLRPSGVADLFSMGSLQLVMEPSRGTAEVLGEGPASMDAPIILPTAIPVTSVDVPILMYHLVDHIPPRSIEPSAYGWRLEVGTHDIAERLRRADGVPRQHRSDCHLTAAPR